ncbi:MAG: response regulator [Cytophagaceae bacterium]
MNRINSVLLIDDDLINNFINERLIRSTGISHVVRSVLNGKLALEYIKEFSAANDNNCPELILLDINMPVMDGFEFLNQFRNIRFSNQVQIKIVVLSTSSHERDLNQAKNYGIELFINKPLSKDKIEVFFRENFLQTGTSAR